MDVTVSPALFVVVSWTRVAPEDPIKDEYSDVMEITEPSESVDATTEADTTYDDITVVPAEFVVVTGKIVDPSATDADSATDVTKVLPALFVEVTGTMTVAPPVEEATTSEVTVLPAWFVVVMGDESALVPTDTEEATIAEVTVLPAWFVVVTRDDSAVDSIETDEPAVPDTIEPSEAVETAEVRSAELLWAELPSTDDSTVA